jgi:2-oxoglutarate ferredoxin oxidoreductase subunit beta
MPGLVPGIHVLLSCAKDVDGRVRPGHDGFSCNAYFITPISRKYFITPG